MSLGRLGWLLAGVGAIAFSIHAAVAGERRQVASDCAAWARARRIIADQPTLSASAPGPDDAAELDRGLAEPDMSGLWNARRHLARHPEAARTLIAALRDPSVVGLTNAADVFVMDREMPFGGHGFFVTDDLFRRAGRASWLLKQATGRADAGCVAVSTNPVLLEDLAKSWSDWLDRLDDGARCSP